MRRALQHDASLLRVLPRRTRVHDGDSGPQADAAGGRRCLQRHDHHGGAGEEDEEGTIRGGELRMFQEAIWFILRNVQT